MPSIAGIEATMPYLAAIQQLPPTYNVTGNGNSIDSIGSNITMISLSSLEQRLFQQQQQLQQQQQQQTQQLPISYEDGVDQTSPTSLSSITSILLSNFLPNDSERRHSATNAVATATISLPTFSPPSIENLVASSAEDLNNFRDMTFDIFDDDDDLFGSPLPFDASENGLWNGRFVPPPPRPPFFVDEPVLSDGLTTCDLCSWAMPTKSTFIFEGTIEKATELGWPLTLIIVSILSALLGAIIMVTVVRCRRNKASHNRNENHVQWWSRHKRGAGPHVNNNNHLRRSNIYTAHPADSIRGLQQPTLSAASSLTAMTAMGGTTTAAGTPGSSSQQQQQFFLPTTSSHQHQHQHQHPHPHSHSHHHQQQQLQQQQQQQQQQPLYHHAQNHHYHHQHHAQTSSANDYDEFEHEYHQPQELRLHHQRQHSSSMSSLTLSSPSLTGATTTTIMPLQMQLHKQPTSSVQHLDEIVASGTTSNACRWPSATLIVAS